MGVTADRLAALKLVDEVLSEPLGGAHRDPDAMAQDAEGVAAAPPRRPGPADARTAAGGAASAPRQLRRVLRQQDLIRPGAMRGQMKAREGSLGQDLLQQLQRAGARGNSASLHGGAFRRARFRDAVAPAGAGAGAQPGQAAIARRACGPSPAGGRTQFRALCRRLARQLDVPLAICDVQVRVPPGGSMEEHARLARYAALRSQLRGGELLLTAQHADDQLETVLLALLRGAGPKGLAAMPADMAFGAGRLLRPLLGISRAAIARHAAAAGLEWIEDPSNAQPRFDRNYLRARVVPRLRERWPSVAETVARSARHCGDAAAQLESGALRDVDAAADGPDLEVAVLRRWNRTRQKAVLRAWIARHGLRLPDERHLEQILKMLDARPDASPFLDWPGARLRRHAGRLLLAPAGSAPAPGDALAVDWDWRQSLVVPGRATGHPAWCTRRPGSRSPAQAAARGAQGAGAGRATPAQAAAGTPGSRMGAWPPAAVV